MEVFQVNFGNKLWLLYIVYMKKIGATMQLGMENIHLQIDIVRS